MHLPGAIGSAICNHHFAFDGNKCVKRQKKGRESGYVSGAVAGEKNILGSTERVISDDYAG